MIRVLTDFLEVVMFPADADTLLCVGGSTVFAFTGRQEHILELIHTGVCEEKGGIFPGNHRCARNDPVTAVLKKLEKIPSDFICCHRGNPSAETGGNVTTLRVA